VRAERTARVGGGGCRVLQMAEESKEMKKKLSLVKTEMDVAMASGEI
jgi:hypothetical protein